jgi:hypothetical protein
MCIRYSTEFLDEVGRQEHGQITALQTRVLALRHGIAIRTRAPRARRRSLPSFLCCKSRRRTKSTCPVWLV